MAERPVAEAVIAAALSIDPGCPRECDGGRLRLLSRSGDPYEHHPAANRSLPAGDCAKGADVGNGSEPAGATAGDLTPSPAREAENGPSGPQCRLLYRWSR